MHHSRQLSRSHCSEEAAAETAQEEEAAAAVRGEECEEEAD